MLLYHSISGLSTMDISWISVIVVHTESVDVVIIAASTFLARDVVLTAKLLVRIRRSKRHRCKHEQHYYYEDSNQQHLHTPVPGYGSGVGL